MLSYSEERCRWRSFRNDQLHLQQDIGAPSLKNINLWSGLRTAAVRGASVCECNHCKQQRNVSFIDESFLRHCNRKRNIKRRSLECFIAAGECGVWERMQVAHLVSDTDSLIQLSHSVRSRSSWLSQSAVTGLTTLQSGPGSGGGVRVGGVYEWCVLLRKASFTNLAFTRGYKSSTQVILLVSSVGVWYVIVEIDRLSWNRQTILR